MADVLSCACLMDLMWCAGATHSKCLICLVNCRHEPGAWIGMADVLSCVCLTDLSQPHTVNI